MKGLYVYEMKVWGVELLNCYNSDDECGRFNNVDLISGKCHIYICLLLILYVMYVCNIMSLEVITQISAISM